MRSLLVLTTFLLLAACDAGHREDGAPDPGGDNAFPGPQLAITTPGPGQRIPAGREPMVMFHLRNTQAPERKAGDHIRYSLDGGPEQRVADPTRPVALAAAASPGEHVIRAFVAKADGSPYENAEARVERVFTVEE